MKFITKIVKNSKETIAPVLKTLFDACMTQGIYTDCFKTAQVIFLFKGGGKTNINSYMLIPLLPALGKVLEKVIFVRMMTFLQEKNILSEK